MGEVVQNVDKLKAHIATNQHTQVLAVDTFNASIQQFVCGQYFCKVNEELIALKIRSIFRSFQQNWPAVGTVLRCAASEAVSAWTAKTPSSLCVCNAHIHGARIVALKSGNECSTRQVLDIRH